MNKLSSIPRMTTFEIEKYKNKYGNLVKSCHTGHNRKMQEEEDVKIIEDAERSEASEDPEREENAEGKMLKLREELSACRKDKQEYMDGWQRAKADYVNLLKRIETDAKASEFRGRVRAVETLLPAFDALERAKEHLPAQVGGDVPEGFMGIAKQLESAFATLGLEEIGKVGEKFNPAVHEALGQDPAESLETDDTVTVVLEKGWKIGDDVIRPAKVRVACLRSQGHFASAK
ncbi:nucleotide exchange factor GrpE [Candidatus Kaiserbacteria bacterium]|nr:nucleotide exchange factor GrpE [Candidatus Kaiserbacteria bacterium]